MPDQAPATDPNAAYFLPPEVFDELDAILDDLRTYHHSRDELALMFRDISQNSTIISIIHSSSGFNRGTFIGVI